MISFWSYKKEYKKINRKILKKIDQVLLKGNIFFGSELETTNNKMEIFVA